jgi:phospholipid-binding lipoprotein MlaA
MTLTRTIFLIMSVISVAASVTMLPAASSDSDSPMVIITQERIVPVRTLGARGRNSGETCYLRSAVEPQARVHAACSTSSAKPTPTPKPQATPAPKIIAKQLPPAPALAAASPKPNPTPTPTPNPKAKSTPAPAATPASTPAPAKITVAKTAKVQTGKNKGKSTAPANDDLDEYSNAALIADPIEPVNRGIFWVNHQLYHYAFHPLIRAYKTVLPSPVRTGIYNVFDNLEYPVRFVNDLLQWQPKRAGLETEKFIVNSTVGVGGLFKASDKIPWLADVPKTDTGVTFAKWGAPPVCYIVWPVLGPKTLRDSVGFVGDLALYPVTWVTYGAVGGLSGASTLAVSGPDAARTTSDKIDNYNTLTRSSVDRYLAVRSAYVQNRKQAVSK